MNRPVDGAYLVFTIEVYASYYYKVQIWPYDVWMVLQLLRFQWTDNSNISHMNKELLPKWLFVGNIGYRKHRNIDKGEGSIKYL